ncbi:MAG: carotenoid biosynthesis protein [Anaerolineales bacterium]|nr:carotenoid biosynthesis protein [Anaerolineales bacterium]MCS7248238.1 carotenoid biosynthesis protein [Anaerolineales bacterium]MDW8162051.1 carotenoid biosynthesis protein [Anaerolineales bacterium]MDW8448139.1 carotenoid biosynthesis protein [Anaerolineales bacterium]
MHTLRQPFSPLILSLLILWVLTMIALPIVGWTLGEDALRRGMSIGVLVQCAAVLGALQAQWGWRRTLRTSFWVIAGAFLAEWLGSTTGFPFGKYSYTPLLQPQLAGVPLLIPLAWMMMLPPAWAIAQMILGEQVSLNSWKGISLSALAFTAWDLFLDPQMTAWGFWVWEAPGSYFGIPLVNFLGWLLVAAVLTAVAHPNELPLLPLVSLYILTWLFQTIGLGIFWAQPLPALCGFLGMGIFVFLALRARRTRQQAIALHSAPGAREKLNELQQPYVHKELEN